MGGRHPPGLLHHGQGLLPPRRPTLAAGDDGLPEGASRWIKRPNLATQLHLFEGVQTHNLLRWWWWGRGRGELDCVDSTYRSSQISLMRLSTTRQQQQQHQECEELATSSSSSSNSLPIVPIANMTLKENNKPVVEVR